MSWKWNVFYKETKYLAAHRVLRILNDNKSAYRVSTYGSTEVDDTNIMDSQTWTTIIDIHQKASWFSLETIRDVLYMLFESSNDSFKKEVEILNTGKIKELRAKILWEGVTALKDRKYIRKFFSSAKIIIPTFLAIAAALIGTLRCIFH